MRKFVGLLVCLALMFTCAQGMAETDINALVDANVMVNVHDVYAYRTQAVTYFTYSGEVDFEYLSHSEYDEERGVQYSFIYDNGNVEVIGRGEGYGYSAENQLWYVMGFLGDTYEQEMLYYGTQNIGEFEDGQKIVSEEATSEGKLLITVEGAIGEESYYADYAGMTLVTKYVVNPDNLIIEASEVYVRGEDGVEKLLIKTVTEFEKKLEDLFDFSIIEASDVMRETRVIMDPGTDMEFEYVLQTPVNLALALYAPEGYELYEDEACAVILGSTERDENGNYPMTQTIYAAPAK